MLGTSPWVLPLNSLSQIRRFQTSKMKEQALLCHGTALRVEKEEILFTPEGGVGKTGILIIKHQHRITSQRHENAPKFRT